MTYITDGTFSGTIVIFNDNKSNPNLHTERKVARLHDETSGIPLGLAQVIFFQVYTYL